MRPTIAAAAVALLALAGCATNAAQRTADQLALYRAHAGAPVESFPYFHPMTQWTPLGPDALAIWTAPSRAWLLDVSGCQDLEWAQAIRLSDSLGRVTARFDRVQPLGTGLNPMSCRIEQIRPLDVQGIREAERVARANR